MDFERVVAEYAAGILPSESAPGIASALIDSGVDDASLAELVSLNRPTWREARELFEHGLAAAGLQIPSAADAKLRLLHWTLRAITMGEVGPRAGAEQLWKCWHELGIPYELAISELLVLAELWDEQPEKRTAIETDILRVADALQSQYPKPSGLTIAEADKG